MRELHDDGRASKRGKRATTCTKFCTTGFTINPQLVLHQAALAGQRDKETREHTVAYNKDSRQIRGETPVIRLKTMEKWLELLNPQSNAISVNVRFWSFIISLARLMRCARK